MKAKKTPKPVVPAAAQNTVSKGADKAELEASLAHFKAVAAAGRPAARLGHFEEVANAGRPATKLAHFRKVAEARLPSSVIEKLKAGGAKKKAQEPEKPRNEVDLNKVLLKPMFQFSLSGNYAHVMPSAFLNSSLTDTEIIIL